MKKKGTIWVKTRTPLLWRHAPSGVFYSRVKLAGKDVWRSLDTDLLSVARNRLAAKVAEIRGARNRGSAPSVRQALEGAAADKGREPDLEENTKLYYQRLVTTIVRTFPDPDMRLDKVQPADMEEWKRRHAQQHAASRTNGAIVLWRHAFRLAMDAGFIGTDPSRKLRRRQVEQRRYPIPTRADFERIVVEVQGQKKANSTAAAFALRFLAFTGLRKGDARKLRWGDIDGTSIIVRIEKNNELRRIPLIPAALALLEEMRAVENHRPGDPVILCSPHEALRNACRRLGLPHLRLHDLRHVFATRCIESGVDLPTLSRWLGHKDGGVLAARIYGHLTDDHSATQAGKVVA